MQTIINLNFGKGHSTMLLETLAKFVAQM